VTVDNISIGNFYAAQALLTVHTSNRAGDLSDEAWGYRSSDTGYCFIGLESAEIGRPTWRACLDFQDAPSGLFECWPSEIMTADSLDEVATCPQLSALAEALADAIDEVAGCGGQEGEEAACAAVDSLDRLVEATP